MKSKLETQFGREPTLIEWAEAVELNCRDLQSELQSGNISREKLINANLRLVVHVAKQYQGRGLNLQDLLQVNNKTFNIANCLHLCSISLIRVSL